MDRMFNSFFDMPAGRREEEVRKPKVNVSEDEKAVTMTVELPALELRIWICR